MSARGTTRRLRVLTLVDNLAPAGGAERLAAEIAMGLDRRRFEPSACTTRPNYKTSYVDEVRAAGVEVLTLDRASRGDLRPWARLARFVRDRRIDVLHAHSHASNVWGSVAGALLRIPVVLAHEHTWSFEGEPLRVLLDREVVARFSDRFLAVSQEDRRRMVEIERIDPAKLVFVPNGIPPLPLPDAGVDLRAELGLAPETPVVGSIGVLRAQKAYPVLVEAVALLRDELPELRLVIVGPDGPGGTGDRDRVLSLAHELGIGDRLLLPGLRRDVWNVLPAFDVLASSSDFEGSPLAVMEWMAAGKPIVATAVGGVPDLIEDGVHGRLVPRRDPRALAGALAELLRDPALRARLGEAAAARQAAEFTIERMVSRLGALYEQLFAATRRAEGERWRAPESQAVEPLL